MRKLISTQTHGLMDYVSGLGLLMLPRLLNLSKPLSYAVESVAATKLLTTIMTDNETGIVRKIPMKGHLVLDAVNGAALCALPFIMGDDDEDQMATMALVGMGVNEIMLATTTQTTPSDRSIPKQVGKRIARTSSQGMRKVRQSVGA